MTAAPPDEANPRREGLGVTILGPFPISEDGPGIYVVEQVKTNPPKRRITNGGNENSSARPLPHMLKESDCQEHKLGVEEEVRDRERGSPLSPESNTITLQQPSASHPERKPPMRSQTPGD